MQEDSQNCSEEEHDRVHDAKCPGSSQHPAVLCKILRPFGASLFTVVTKWTNVDVDTRCTEVLAISIVNAAKLIDSGNECTHKAEIDEGNKEGRSPSGVEAYSGRKSPCKSEHRDNEEGQDGFRSELIVVVEAIHEPGLRMSAEPSP